jgi:hypothetical protein
MTALTLSTALAACLSAMSLGGATYEYRVIDPIWPGNPVVIQPARGGVDRKRFWIAMHSAFEAVLLASLLLAWNVPEVRVTLLVALVSHAVLRVWSLADFIPKALDFERAEPWSVEAPKALSWVRRSLGRLPLAVLTCVACLTAFALSWA